MVGIKKVLKVLAGFFGSIFMFFGVLFFFLTLITGNMIYNVDNIDSSVAASMQKFVAENKVEIREFVLDSMDQQGINLSKEMVAVLCVSPSMLDMAGDQGAAFKTALTPDVCNNIDAVPFEETKAKLMDNVIENNIDSIVKLPQTQELKDTVKQQGQELTTAKPFLIGFSIVLFIIGGVLTFAGVGFDWKRGTYKVCMKTGIRLLMAAFGLLLLSQVSSNLIIDTMKAIQSQAPQMMVTEAPPILLQLISTIILDWLKLSTNPYIYVTLFVGLPFLAVAIIMRFTILKNPNEEKNPANKRVI
ncbi:MAG: hypothetical protein WC852_02640 [Candidatus Nanoarchaeia archaeon]|jgi:hypothetical protein